MAVNKIEHWQFADADPMDAQVEQASYGPLRSMGTVIHGTRNVIETLRAPRRRIRRPGGPAFAGTADRHLPRRGTPPRCPEF
jgi:hypothetical protein